MPTRRLPCAKSRAKNSPSRKSFRPSPPPWGAGTRPTKRRASPRSSPPAGSDLAVGVTLQRGQESGGLDRPQCRRERPCPPPRWNFRRLGCVKLREITANGGRWCIITGRHAGPMRNASRPAAPPGRHARRTPEKRTLFHEVSLVEHLHPDRGAAPHPRRGRSGLAAHRLGLRLRSRPAAPGGRPGPHRPVLSGHRRADGAERAGPARPDARRGRLPRSKPPVSASRRPLPRGGRHLREDPANNHRNSHAKG